MAAQTVPSLSAVKDSTAIDKCSACGAGFALRAPCSTSPALPWICTSCGAAYFARPQDKNGKPYVRGARQGVFQDVVRTLSLRIENKTATISRRDVQRLAECMGSQTFAGDEARKQTRHRLAAPVVAMPLGADFRVVGPPVQMTTMNVSGGGAALLHAQRIAEPYLALDFAPSGVNLLPAILQVTRVRSLGNAFEIAGDFQCRIIQTS